MEDQSTDLSQYDTPVPTAFFNLNESDLASLLHWVQTKSPFSKQDLIENWRPQHCSELDYELVLEELTKSEWIVGSNEDDLVTKYYSPSTPKFLMLRKRLLVCLHSAKDLLQGILNSSESTECLKLQMMLETSTPVTEIFQTILQLNKLVERHQTLLTHVAQTIPRINAATITLEEEEVADIEASLKQKWGETKTIFEQVDGLIPHQEKLDLPHETALEAHKINGPQQKRNGNSSIPGFSSFSQMEPLDPYVAMRQQRPGIGGFPHVTQQQAKAMFRSYPQTSPTKSRHEDYTDLALEMPVTANMFSNKAYYPDFPTNPHHAQKSLDPHSVWRTQRQIQHGLPYQRPHDFARELAAYGKPKVHPHAHGHSYHPYEDA